jgi:hypothetical protein
VNGRGKTRRHALRVFARKQHIRRQRAAAALRKTHDGQVDARKDADRSAVAQAVGRAVEALRVHGGTQRFGEHGA